MPPIGSVPSMITFLFLGDTFRCYLERFHRDIVRLAL
jgi:hypothetical protein